MSYKDD